MRIINEYHAEQSSILTNNCKQVSPWGLIVITIIILPMIA